MTRSSRFAVLCLGVGLLLAAASPLAVGFAAQCADMAEAAEGPDMPERCPGLWSSCCDYGPPSPRVAADTQAKAQFLAGHAMFGAQIGAVPVDLRSALMPALALATHPEWHGPPESPPTGAVTILRL